MIPDLSRFHRMSMRTMGFKVRLRFSMIRTVYEHDPVFQEITCKNWDEAAPIIEQWYEAKNASPKRAERRSATSVA